MNTKPVHLRRTSLEIEAMQIAPDDGSTEGGVNCNSLSIAAASGWMMARGFKTFKVTAFYNGLDSTFHVEGLGITLEKPEEDQHVFPGWWVARDIWTGEFFPLPDAIRNHDFVEVER